MGQKEDEKIQIRVLSNPFPLSCLRARRDTLTENTGANVDDSTGQRRRLAAGRKNQVLDGELMLRLRQDVRAPLAVGLRVLGLILGVGHLVDHAQLLGLVPGEETEQSKLRLRLKLQIILINKRGLPEDQNAGSHQSVGQQSANRHELHQVLQVEQKSHHSCRSRGENITSDERFQQISTNVMQEL